MFKPNIKFLQKVADNKVYRYGTYSPKHGKSQRFVGGEIIAQKHADAGFITMPSYPRTFETKYATLTASGRAAIVQTRFA